MGRTRRATGLVQTGDGPGIDGGIVRRQGDAPATGAAVNAYVCTIGVESLDETLDSIIAKGRGYRRAKK